jgi:hypothetical protein
VNYQMKLMRVFHCYVILAVIAGGCTLDSIVPPEPGTAGKLPFEGGVLWSRNFGGTGTDTFHSVISTADGGFAVLGSSNSTDGDLEGKDLAVSDYWLVKFDASADKQWSRTYGGSGEDLGQALIQTADGGYALTGYAMSSDGDATNNEGFHDNWVLKLDSAGDIQWQQSFGYPGHDHSYDIIQTADGGLFFVGFLDVTAANGEGNSGKYSSLTRHGVGEFWGTKLAADGTMQWRRYFGGTNNDRAYAVTESHSGGYVMAGFSESTDFDISSSKGSYDFWVVKVGTDGEMIWERSFGGSGIDISYDILATRDGAYIVVGNTFSADTDVAMNSGGSDVWMIKLSDEGDLLWERNFGGGEFDAAQGVSQTADGGYVVTGNSRSTNGDTQGNNGENDLWILKTDENGQLQWQDTFGGSGLDFGFNTIQLPNRDLLVVGETGSTDFGNLVSRGNTDAVILRINSGLRQRSR